MVEVKERDVEYYLKQRVKAMGGETRKVRWVGRAHAPDRFILLPYVTFWVETKRPKDPYARSGQRREHDRLRRSGEEVYVCFSKEQVDSVLRRYEGKSG